LTQHRGYYCPYCGVRYVAHACKGRLGLPAQMENKRAEQGPREGWASKNVDLKEV